MHESSMTQVKVNDDQRYCLARLVICPLDSVFNNPGGGLNHLCMLASSYSHKSGAGWLNCSRHALHVYQVIPNVLPKHIPSLSPLNCIVPGHKTFELL